MFDEKLVTLQEMGGENELEELIFDLQRFADDSESGSGYVPESSDSVMSATATDLVGQTDNDSVSATTATTDLSKTSGSTFVALSGSGNQAVRFNNDGGNIAYIDSAATGNKAIQLGNGSDAVVFEGGSNANVNVVGGKGEDSIVVQGDAKGIAFNMKSGGADKIYLSGSSDIDISLNNYAASSGGGIMTGYTDKDNLVNALAGDDIAFGNGVLTINGSGGGTAKVRFDGTDPSGNTFFNLYDDSGEMQAVGFTHKAGGSLNVGTNSTTDYVLIGNKDGKKTDTSSIISGKGNDTAFAGAGDVINLGAGSNQVVLDTTTENRDGAAVAMTAGRTTVTGFKTGFEETSDGLLVDLSDANITFTDGNLNIKGSNFRGQLNEIAAAETGSHGSGTYAEVAINGTINAAIANGDATIDASSGANYFKGNGDAVNFGGIDGEVNINLTSDWNSSINGVAAGFSGITQFQGGDGKTTIWSGAANETLSAGNGNTSLYGAGGKNVLNGYDNSAGDKDSRTTFFVLGNADGAANTVNNFQFADTATDKSTADVLEIDTNTNLVSGVRANADGVVLEVSNRAGTATEKVLISDAVGRNFYVTENVVAQVNVNEVSYDGQANFFVATGANASVKVENELTNTAEIWLDGKPNNGLGKNFVGDIKVLDATNFAGKAELAGSENTDNIIYGGTGKNSLWGGNGAEGNDLMVGGTGAQNNFFYTNGNGNDTIRGTNAGDVVYLAEVSLDQLASTSVENGTAVLNFKDGGQLTVADAANCQFVMTQGDQSQVYKIENGQFVAG